MSYSKKFRTSLLAAVLFFTLLGIPMHSAEAVHFGAYIGPSIFTGNPPYNGSSTVITSGGFDAGMSFTPAFEVGAYYFRTLSYYRTLIGVEANFFPLLTHLFYAGAKLGNSNLADDNHITYGPVAGFNYDIAPTLSVGVDGTYYIYNNMSLREVNLLANIKFWL